MITFAFWNIKGRFLPHILDLLVSTYNIDILALAEAGENVPEQIGELAHSPGRVGTKVTLYSRSYLSPIEEAPRWTIRSLAAQKEEVLLVVAHLPSALHFTETDRAMEAGHFSRAIRDVEARRGHSRTLVVGDLNMNPFEAGMVGTEGLHAISSHQIAQEGTRTVQGREFPFFYNPMWTCLGDTLFSIPGTYHYRKASPICYFWNTFDQVLLRPSLLPFWMPDALQILTQVGDITLLDQGRPDAHQFSDHLPILCRFDL